MVIVCWGYPGAGNTNSRAQHVLHDQDYDLQPDPADQHGEGARVVLNPQHILLYAVEIAHRRKPEHALPDHESVEQRFTAVAHDVPVDLWDPEGEVQEGEGVGVDGAGGRVPACSVQGEES